MHARLPPTQRAIVAHIDVALHPHRNLLAAAAAAALRPRPRYRTVDGVVAAPPVREQIRLKDAYGPRPAQPVAARAQVHAGLTIEDGGNAATSLAPSRRIAAPPQPRTAKK